MNKYNNLTELYVRFVILLRTRVARIFKRIFIVIFFLTVAGCVNNRNYSSLDSNTKSVSQSNQTSKGGNKSASIHIVRKGETLYSIALGNDLDYKQLARVNHIGNNFKIVPGQKLSLVLDSIQKPAQVTRAIKSDINPNSKKNIEEAGQKKQLKIANNPTNIKWGWPLSRTIVRTSSDIVRQLKGIDIKSQFGEPVVAAADGLVVFAGSGLRGYGNLIIIQHPDNYLSAYAYTSEILVKEKQEVNAGDQIAKVGTSGTVNSPALHFEIRKNGKPEDPLAHLP